MTHTDAYIHDTHTHIPTDIIGSSSTPVRKRMESMQQEEKGKEGGWG